jgi:hypothetical protein|tara:strand:+ start:88 stop:540 length:453 start_codon:yes stop_codon:yes gene_type:complete
MPSRRGWKWDGANSRLDVDVDGTTVARFDDGTGDIEIVSGTINVADGGTVTQATNKSTAVTLNTHSGQITMNGAALGDDAIVSFQVNNSNVAATDVVIVNHSSGGTIGSYVVQAHTPASGSFKIGVKNVSGGSLSEALVISFAVIKGASS